MNYHAIGVSVQSTIHSAHRDTIGKSGIKIITIAISQVQQHNLSVPPITLSVHHLVRELGRRFSPIHVFLSVKIM